MISRIISCGVCGKRIWQETLDPPLFILIVLLLGLSIVHISTALGTSSAFIQDRHPLRGIFLRPRRRRNRRCGRVFCRRPDLIQPLHHCGKRRSVDSNGILSPARSPSPFCHVERLPDPASLAHPRGLLFHGPIGNTYSEPDYPPFPVRHALSRSRHHRLRTVSPL